jgi:hypothetical protein
MYSANVVITLRILYNFFRWWDPRGWKTIFLCRCHARKKKVLRFTPPSTRSRLRQYHFICVIYIQLKQLAGFVEVFYTLSPPRNSETLCTAMWHLESTNFVLGESIAEGKWKTAPNRTDEAHQHECLMASGETTGDSRDFRFFCGKLRAPLLARVSSVACLLSIQMSAWVN